MKQCKSCVNRTGTGILMLIGMLAVLTLSGSQVFAVTDHVVFAVNGDTTATSMVSGDELAWGANCEVGASVQWEIWYDVDVSGDIDELVDAHVATFVAADGDTASDGPPPDINPIPDGLYISVPIVLGISAGQYIFRVTDLSDDTQATGIIEVTALVSPANTFAGRIVVDGHPAPDPDVLQWVWVEADLEEGMQMWATFTDENGDFSIELSDAATGLTFRVEPGEIAGFVRPSSQEVIASGYVELDDFLYQTPSDIVYGAVTDENYDPLPMPAYVWASPMTEGLGQKNTETVNGEYILYFAESELGDWWIGVSSDNLAPDYLTPPSVSIDNSAQHGIEVNFVCLTADTVLYALVTEGGAEPTHSYMIQAFDQTDNYTTQAVSGTGSNNLVELHISSAYENDWSVQVTDWDSTYMIPEGYVLESTTMSNLNPGDTVHLNFIAGKILRDTITVDPGDPIPNWNTVSVGLYDGQGHNYWTQPDGNGVFTITADTGTYSLNAMCNGYYALPSLRAVHLTEDTTGGLGFMLNQTHCTINGMLSGVSLPLSGYIFVTAITEGIGLAATVDTLTGMYSFEVFDGDWVLTPPYVDGYNTPDTAHLIIDEIPDTLRTVNFSYSPYLGIEDGSSASLPKSFDLGQNHPNPFNPSTSFEYSLPASSRVKIELFNLLGQQVRTLVDEAKGAGTYRVEWDGTDASGNPVASGIYLYRIVADNYVQTRKMMLLK